jgi:hypothetical protein
MRPVFSFEQCASPPSSDVEMLLICGRLSMNASGM